MARLTISQQLTNALSENEELKAKLASAQVQLAVEQQRLDESLVVYQQNMDQLRQSSNDAAAKYIAEAEAKLKSAIDMKDCYSRLYTEITKHVDELQKMLDSFPGIPDRYQEGEHNNKVEMFPAARLSAFMAKQLFKSVG